MIKKDIYIIFGAKGAIGSGFKDYLVDKNCDILPITHAEKGTYESEGVIYSNYNFSELGPLIISKCRSYEKIKILYAMGGNFGCSNNFTDDELIFKLLKINLLIPLESFTYFHDKLSNKKNVFSIFLSSGSVKYNDSTLIYSMSKMALEKYLEHVNHIILSTENLHCIRLPGVRVPNKKWQKLYDNNPQIYKEEVKKYGMNDVLTKKEVCKIIYDTFNNEYYRKYRIKLWEY